MYTSPVGILLFIIIDDNLQCKGAPEVPEPLTLGVQYLTRYNTWKNFVRATRPAIVCASPIMNIRV